ncbi:penicillin-binding protein activator LpoB [Sulfurimonas sp.]|nr:penicillin-binding protein activator LpoB [Sulfurimonas sp.]
MSKKIIKYIGALMSVMLLSGCVGLNKTTVDNTPGRTSIYQDINSVDQYSGVGVESQDISSMTDKMVRDLMSMQHIVAKSTAPRIIIDEQYFKNQSSSRINKALITERLMVNLNRASRGRLIFLERGAMEMIEAERAMKRSGHLSEGSLGSTNKIYGADYRLTGKIMSLDAINQKSGGNSRYHQISFKLVDLETGAIVWSNMYEFKKAAQTDVIYR